MGVGEVLEVRGIKQGWLAAQVGVSDAMMSRMLASKRRWTAERKQLAAQALGIPVSMLFEGDGVPGVPAPSRTGVPILHRGEPG